MIISDDEGLISTSSRGRRRRATTRLETSTDVNLSRRLLALPEASSFRRQVVRETRTIVEEEVITVEEDASGRRVIPHRLRGGKRKKKKQIRNRDKKKNK